jgi:immune inhibitor A
VQKNRQLAAVAGAAVAALAVTMASASAQAKPLPTPHEPSGVTRSDNLPNPLADAQSALQQEAVTKLVQGKASTEIRGGERVIKLAGNKAKDAKGTKAARDRYVRYPINRKESVFTILTDFGTQTMPAVGGTPGPAHNQIPEPDRNWDGSATDDNNTNWVADFNTQHYQDLLFDGPNSFKTFYQKQSNGRFQASGDVSDWVSVPYNEARYGSNDPAASDGYWAYIKDTASSWYDAQKAAGKSDAEIATYLKQFDKVDRYDYDHDGNFNEPDGYIDHFQAIHAGIGEEAGGGAQGADAIWSHRSYAFSNDQGQTGPSGNLLGGVPLGTSGIWIGDYTTEAENGGLGVFAHEFGHDLGLIDYYDTAGGDNGTGFWTIMSAGSWLNKGQESIGTSPGYMGPHEKLLLGWLDYKTVGYGADSNVKVGPADRDDAALPQALLVNLPDKTVHTDYNTPHSGSTEWWGGSADNLNSTLTRTIDLTGATSASVSSWVWANIEDGYDYLYGEVSTDGGATWADVGDPLTGEATDWAQHSWDLTSFAGQQVTFRFRYATDGGVHFEGPFLDDIAITVDGTTTTDDVEGGDNGWTGSGFTRMSGSTDVVASHYYLAENRTYKGFDANLKTGPYIFGYTNTRPNWVERFPYQNGLLVWYIDNEFTDNNTISHPGGGLALPVDARPTPVVFPDGGLLGNRRQPFDATFGQQDTNAVTFHRNGVPVKVASSHGIPAFTDTDVDKYWSAANPLGSVKVAGTGTTIRVVWTSPDNDRMNLQVRFAKP